MGQINWLLYKQIDNQYLIRIMFSDTYSNICAIACVSCGNFFELSGQSILSLTIL